MRCHTISLAINMNTNPPFVLPRELLLLSALCNALFQERQTFANYWVFQKYVVIWWIDVCMDQDILRWDINGTSYCIRNICAEQDMDSQGKRKSPPYSGPSSANLPWGQARQVAGGRLTVLRGRVGEGVGGGGRQLWPHSWYQHYNTAQVF